MTTTVVREEEQLDSTWAHAQYRLLDEHRAAHFGTDYEQSAYGSEGLASPSLYSDSCAQSDLDLFSGDLAPQEWETLQSVQAGDFALPGTPGADSHSDVPAECGLEWDTVRLVQAGGPCLT